MRALLAAAVLTLPAAPVHAHATGSTASPAAWLLGIVLVAALAYARGISNLWASARRGHGVSARCVAAYYAGLGLLAVLVSETVEAYTAASFAAHMAQHEVLMLLVAPLLVLGRPLATWTWALPRSSRASVAQRFQHPAWRVPWRALTSPVGASMAQLALLLVWHLPTAFDAAVADPWVHALQHFSFLAPALAFAWVVLGARHRAHTGPVLAALFVTMIATSALGALLTFARHPIYATYARMAEPLADQQLGGLLMWIPGGLVYLGAALWIVAGRLTGKEALDRVAGH